MSIHNEEFSLGPDPWTHFTGGQDYYEAELYFNFMAFKIKNGIPLDITKEKDADKLLDAFLDNMLNDGEVENIGNFSKVYKLLSYALHSDYVKSTARN
jgi:hypothetical protein